jgi:CDP-diacylglycerol--glycerol-3-phosphate 3-phosphatidyltransferase
MTLADKITFSRLALTPFAVALFFLPGALPSSAVWATVAVWIIAVYSELSDYLDGYVARRQGQISDFGKVFDPFADVLMHLSYFVSFCVAGAMPLAFVLVVLFREYAVMLIRLLTAKKGIMMGARPGGKAKTVSYVITGGAVLLRVSLQRFGLFPGADRGLGVLVDVLCVVSGIMSLLSLLDYLRQYRKLSANG